MVSVQLEVAREDVWVPDGLAVAQRSYEPNGIPFNLTDRGGLAFPEETFVRQGNGGQARTFKPTQTVWVININSNGDPQKAVDLGPTLAQSRMAIPVRPGMKVNWSGQYQVRRTGWTPDDENGTTTSVDIRTRLWGTGTTVDEYGVETDIAVPLLEHRQRLQDYVFGNPPSNRLNFTLPTLPDAVVPANVDRIYLAFTLIAVNTGSEWTGKYRSFNWIQGGALDSGFFAIMDATKPTIYVRKPDVLNHTTPNALSATGHVFRNRTQFTNVPAAAELVLCADTGAVGAVTVQAWAGSTLLANVVVPAGGRVVTAIAPPAASTVTLTSTGNYGVERCTAARFETLLTEQTRLHKYTYVDVIGDVNRIKTEGIESDLSITTLRFISNEAGEQMAPGRRVRIVGKYPGGHAVIFTGTVRGRRIVSSFSRKAEVEIAVHTDHGRLGQVDFPVAYDQVAEYGQLVHAAGSEIVLNGVDYTGPPRPLPDGWDYFPSYYSEKMKLTESLEMVRNTNKGFMFHDRHNRCVYRDTLPTEVVADFSDRPGQGDMSYTLNVEQGSDTKSLVNAVSVTEHLLDRKDFVERVLDRTEAPVLFGDVKSRTQTVEYRRPESIDLYGMQKVSFDVVRGSGTWEDLYADNYGTNFAAWAGAILDEYSAETTDFNRIGLAVTTDAHIALVSKLQVLDAVAIRMGQTVQVRRIRRIVHDIKPNRWTVELRFDVTRGQSYWVPPTPVPVLTLGDVDAGTLARPATAIIDGGHPADTVTSILDGGTL